MLDWISLALDVFILMALINVMIKLGRKPKRRSRKKKESLTGKRAPIINNDASYMAHDGWVDKE